MDACILRAIVITLPEMVRHQQEATMPDLTLECPQCRNTFMFTEAEQAQYAEQAFPPPTYCPICLRQRKASRDEERDRRRSAKRRRR